MRASPGAPGEEAEMADRFGADPVMARNLAGVLTELRADLGRQRDVLAAGAAVTGSDRVSRALTEFDARSGDARRELDHLLERAAALLDQLADGVGTVDRGLSTGIDAGMHRATGAVGSPLSPSSSSGGTPAGPRADTPGGPR